VSDHRQGETAGKPPAAAPPPVAEQQPMDIHKPKPVNSLKELASEIGVIVIGILIALGLEQGIESYRERQKVAEAHAAIEEEVREALTSAHVLQASRDCRQRQFAALTVTLAKDDMGRLRSMLNESRILPLIAIQDAAWKTAQATGVADRFDRGERGYYGTASFLSASVQDLFLDYHRSEERLTFFTQSSLAQTPAASSQALAQLAEMASDMDNIEGQMASYSLLFEQGLRLKAKRADYDARLSGTDFVQQCQAAAKALEARAGEA
jgi:hypothetical protein